MLRKEGYKVMANNSIYCMDKQGEKNKDYLKKMSQKTISKICFQEKRNKGNWHA